MTDEPSKLVTAIQIAKRTNKIVRENIIFALGVKGGFLIPGALGISGMWEAVFCRRRGNAVGSNEQHAIIEMTLSIRFTNRKASHIVHIRLFKLKRLFRSQWICHRQPTIAA